MNNTIECTILGCGGSKGVPEVACGCCVCSSYDQRDKRTRSSIYLKSEKTSILVDTSPDLHQQLILHRINSVDYILYTHAHFDHIAGVDDIKPIIKLHQKEHIVSYMSGSTGDMILSRLSYAFDNNNRGYKPFLLPKIFGDDELFSAGDVKIQPFPQNHGQISSSGFRFGDLAYSTDVHCIDDKHLCLLDGIKIWIVGCLRYFYVQTHFNVEMVIKYAERLKPEQIILTHMGHHLGYNELCDLLPHNIRPAYDGMKMVFRGW